MQNKPNLRVFWAVSGDCEEKQSQTNPIPPARYAIRDTRYKPNQTQSPRIKQENFHALLFYCLLFYYLRPKACRKPNQTQPVVSLSNLFQTFDFLLPSALRFPSWLFELQPLAYILYCLRPDTANGRTIEMHRQILNAPAGLLCDHKNHNGLDNRRANLRLCTPSQNSQNQLPRAGFSSIYKGVSREKNKWRADIRLNGRPIFIGYFDDQIDAAIAYDDMAIELFGEFACLNLDFHPEITSWLKDSYLFDPTHYKTACLCR